MIGETLLQNYARIMNTILEYKSAISSGSSKAPNHKIVMHGIQPYLRLEKLWKSQPKIRGQDDFR